MMKGFLEYVPGDSFLHRMNPVAKLGAALLLVIGHFHTAISCWLALPRLTQLVKRSANAAANAPTARAVAPFAVWLGAHRGAIVHACKAT